MVLQAVVSGGDRTGFYTSPTLGFNARCSVEQDKGPSPRKLQPVTREGTTCNDLIGYTGQKPFLLNKITRECQNHLDRKTVFWLSQRPLGSTPPCPWAVPEATSRGKSAPGADTPARQQGKRSVPTHTSLLNMSEASGSFPSAQDQTLSLKNARPFP